MRRSEFHEDRYGWNAETLLLIAVLCGGIVGCQMERHAPDDWPLKRDPRKSQGGSEKGEGPSGSLHSLPRAAATPPTPSPAIFRS